MRIYLKSLPMPISVNHAYATIRIKGQERRVKSKSYRDFEKEMEAWRLQHLIVVGEAKKAIQDSLNRNHPMSKTVLHLEYVFYFNQESLFNIGKKNHGKIKKNDTANRLKVLDDALAEILQVDDTMFWSGHFTKVPMHQGNDPVTMSRKFHREFVDVWISFKEV